MILRAGSYQFEFPRRVMVMGVLNITPDSFSDGGDWMDSELALDRARKMVLEGADVVDVGGESTRPGAEPVSVEEELRRIIPVIKRLAGVVGVPVSVDTMKPEVAEAALGEGASLVNDVFAGGNNWRMWEAVARARAGYVCMHMRGVPRTMQRDPHYQDVVGEVKTFFGEQLDRLGACGVGAEHVILDPGFGFGKALEHNLQLLASVKSFQVWNRPVLVGVSRKSMVGQVTGVSEPSRRLAGSLTGALWAALQGVEMVRVHDVMETVQALKMLDAIKQRPE